MSWLADAHSEWHAVNGPYGCPLDCAMSDPYYYIPDDFEDPDAFLSQSEIEERNAAYYQELAMFGTAPF